MAYFMSIEQVSELLGVSLRTLSRLRESGAGPSFLKIGRRVIYDPVSLKEWIAKNETLLSAGAEQ